MTREDLKTHLSKIEVMEEARLEEFEISVHNSMGLEIETRNELFSAIDSIRCELDKNCSALVEMSELKVGEI